MAARDGAGSGGDGCAVGVCVKDCEKDCVGFGDLGGSRFGGEAEVEDAFEGGGSAAVGLWGYGCSDAVRQRSRWRWGAGAAGHDGWGESSRLRRGVG